MLFLGWLTLVSFTVGVGEYYNCKYPRVDEQDFFVTGKIEIFIKRMVSGYLLP